jgi:DNA-binding LacI/PurR family transcriptional regulator
VARLFDRMKGDEAPPASRSVDYRLVVRESTTVG